MLKFTTVNTTPAKLDVDIFVIECKKEAGKEKKPGKLLKTDGGTELDKILGGLLSKTVKDELFTGELGKHKLINADGKIKAKYILIVGIGEDKELLLDTLRIIGAKISKVADELKVESIGGTIQSERVNKLTSSDRVQALAEGLTIGTYRFDRYKDKKDLDKQTFKSVQLISKDKSTQIDKAITFGSEIGDAINFARDLVNTPGEDMTPDALAKEAARISKAKHLSCKVMNEAEIKRENMRLVMAVSKGAANPPRFVHIKYRPTAKTKTKIALVGKGVTFDSGGYHLKPVRHIENMKCDMGGAAAVLGIMKLLPILKPNVAVDGYIVASENMIDGTSHKPGDVIKSRSGKTIELLNLDAEGRLLMADAFDYAAENKPDILIDIATLTGGVIYALGELYTALLGNDQKLVDDLLKASEEGGEPTWQLPLVKEYLKGYKESIADLNNNGKSLAMTISAAMFLQEFIKDIKKWAHFDIAEAAWAKEEHGYRPKGGTGAGIQTIIRYLMKY